MSSIAALIEQTAIGLYILLAVGIVIYTRQWMIAGYNIRATSFELERDLAREKRANEFTKVVFLVELILVVFGMQMVVAPTIREDRAMMGVIEDEIAQVEDGVFVTPTRPAPSGNVGIDPSGVEFGNDDAVQVFATAVLTATPVGTILPSAPDVQGCDTPNATLQIPANGMRVFQPIRVAGTAFIDDFSTYKLEIGRTDGQFFVLDEKTLPVNELGTLSQFNPAPYEPGTYLFRLMVFDSSVQLRASCRVTIYIDDPIPTPTPIGAESS